MLRSGEVMAVITSNPKNPRLLRRNPRRGTLLVRCHPDYVQRYLPGWPKTMSREELNHAPVVEYDRKDFLCRMWREPSSKKEVGLEAEETFTQSPTIYIPSSPDYARAVSSGMPGASFLRRNAPKSSKRAPLLAGGRTRPRDQPAAHEAARGVTWSRVSPTGSVWNVHPPCSATRLCAWAYRGTVTSLYPFL